MSFYTSITGLKNAQTDLNVISHNIANSETTGFKKSDTKFADIVASSILTDPMLTQGMGARVASITQEFALGPVEQTGSALDVTINGEGFFTIKSPVSGQIAFTRAGSFTVDGGGFLKNPDGNRMQVFPVDDKGVVDTKATPIDANAPAKNAAGADYAGATVAQDGKVTASYADGTNTVIGYVALATFIAPQGLRQLGSASWSATGVSGAPSYGQPNTSQFGSLLSGSLERSNVDIAEELVGLITAQRAFQANAKAVDTSSQISQTIINLRS